MKRSRIHQKDVYDILLHVPEGQVTTYGDIARALGNPNASRAIGRILNKNPDPVSIPCHRVIMSSGKIGGYAYGERRKKQLLTEEGVRFQGDAMIDFENRRASVRGLG